MRYAIIALLCLFSSQVLAEDPKGLEPLPDAPPPPVVGKDTGPEVTITQKGEAKIEEYRSHGHLYMIKVTPKHGAPYYLVDMKGDGRFVRRGSIDPGVRPPMWVIDRF
ncbi:MAG TPA: DUF2782 domain-containing protein [Burkholderiales bacterium]|nr:DUF2782 domain-containing protein [Burkholderiales bacterium]